MNFVYFLLSTIFTFTFILPMLFLFLFILSIYIYLRCKLAKTDSIRSNYRNDFKKIIISLIIVSILYLISYFFTGSSMGFYPNGNWKICHGFIVQDICLGTLSERECCGFQKPLNLKSVSK